MNLHKIFKENWLLILIILMGLILRLIKINGWVSYDEVATFGFIKGIPLRSYLLIDLNPPLYAFFLKLVVKLFGDSALNIRLPSVIFGTSSIFVIYLIAMMLFNRKVGLVAALLLSLSIFQIYYSQTARMYALETFLALMSVFFFLKILDKSSKKYVWGYIIFSFLLLFSQTFGFVTLVAENIYFVIKKKSPEAIKPKKWFVIQSLLWLPFLAWLWILIGWQLPALHQDTTLNFQNFSYAIYMNYRPFSIMLFLIFLIIFAFYKAFFNYQKTKVIFLALWISFVLFFPLILSIFSKQLLFIDHVIILSTIPVFILSSYGFFQISDKMIQRFIIILVIVFSLKGALSYYRNPENDNWPGLIQYHENVDQKVPVIIVPEWYQIMENYYRPKNSQKTVGLLESPHDLSALKKGVENYNRFWLVISNPWIQYQNEMVRALDNYRTIEKKTFGNNLVIYLLEK